MLLPIKLEENYITHKLLQDVQKLPTGVAPDMTYQQISLFDYWGQNAMGG